MNSIREGVISALAERLPDLRVYGEGTSEVLTPPYFMVKLSAVSQAQELNRRYNCTCSFTIQYTPASDTPEGLMYEYMEHLYDLFREIEIEGALYCGVEMRHEVKEGILLFYFDFRFLIWLPEPDAPKMRMLKEEGRIKDGV
ncbi:hypothetical protein D3C74_195960 [compost metagenome]